MKSEIIFVIYFTDLYDSKPNSNFNVVLPTAPKASRGVDDYEDRVPLDPPFNALLTNLPYDVDEGELEEYFSDLRVFIFHITCFTFY